MLVINATVSSATLLRLDVECQNVERMIALYAQKKVAYGKYTFAYVTGLMVTPHLEQQMNTVVGTLADYMVDMLE